MHRRRRSGILLHPTSLPGPGGIGSLGEHAFRFADFLEHAAQSVWQVLPLGPTGYGGSPYSCYSAFAGNPLLIDLALLREEGDLQEPDAGLPADRVNFPAVEKAKLSSLRAAAATFFAGSGVERLADFHRFCDTTPWLHDYALFMAFKEHFQGKSWTEWPEEVVLRDRRALERWSVELGERVGEQKYIQWQFYRQWHRVKQYANERGISVFGDIPIFVALDSCDVWANPQLFFLDEHRRPLFLAGVPPDYFSETGQLWGNPLYDWKNNAAEGYRWWIERMRASRDLYDFIRIDHFRGFAAYWEVPATETTAVRGRWVQGPGRELFAALSAALGELPIIAEDLGTITPDVEELRDDLGFPGMKVLQFAFDSGADNPYLPHNHLRNAVVYTGTHDNDTTAGWFSSRSAEQKQRILHYLNIPTGDAISWELIRTSLSSVAQMSVVPLQDVLSLGSEAKMNLPGTGRGNWSWRLQEGALASGDAARLRELTVLYGRGNPEKPISQVGK